VTALVDRLRALGELPESLGWAALSVDDFSYEERDAIQAALERVPKSLLEASSDLGARPYVTFRHVTLPLAFPGIVAGSIFTFSLTLGDFVVPYSLGNSAYFIGQAVLSLQGTSANIPLAAAFTVVPMIIMGVYLLGARRLGAFDAL